MPRKEVVMSVFQHNADCPALFEQEALCTCEKPRYVKALGIGLPLAGVEHTLGYIFGSEALHADAWHLMGDVTHDVVAWGILVAVGFARHLEQPLRRLGGYCQAALLLLSALAIFVHYFWFGPNPNTSGWAMLIGGAVLAIGNWWRFKILHPDGKPIRLLREVWFALWSGSREVTTFIGEVFHVLSDVGMSVLVALGGLAVLMSGTSAIDEWIALLIAGFLVMGAVTVTLFAKRHVHHH